MKKTGRRTFVKRSAGGIAGAGLAGACGDDAPPAEGARLRILRWEHFVQAYDGWFQTVAQNWGMANGVEVEIEYVDADIIPDRLRAAIAAGEGPDLVETHAPAANFEEDLDDLADVASDLEAMFGAQEPLARASSLNPVTGKYYGLTTAYSVWPANYLRSSWDAVGMPNGPTTYAELLTNGEMIFNMMNQTVGLGFADEDNTSRSLRAILWAYGGRIQDESQNLVLDSAETRAALAYARELFMRTMDVSVEDVFTWTPGSNNDSILGGTSSYIINPISAYRESQVVDPTGVALDMFFAPPPAGPAESGRVMVSTFTQLVPNYSTHKTEAKDFIRHLVSVAAAEARNSELYNIPAYRSGGDELYGPNGFFNNDPFNSDPPDKLALFANAGDWSANVGYPASANAAIADVFDATIIAKMFRDVVQGTATEDQAIQTALDAIGPIYDMWRGRGLL